MNKHRHTHTHTSTHFTHTSMLLGHTEKNVDTLVIGTGLPNCLIAAARSRNGDRVLHVDEACNYGDTWQSLSLLELEKWADASEQEDEGLSVISENEERDPIPDGLHPVPVLKRSSPYTHRRFAWHPFGEEKEENNHEGDEEDRIKNTHKEGQSQHRSSALSSSSAPRKDEDRIGKEDNKEGDKKEVMEEKLCQENNEKSTHAEMDARVSSRCEPVAEMDASPPKTTTTVSVEMEEKRSTSEKKEMGEDTDTVSAPTKSAPSTSSGIPNNTKAEAKKKVVNYHQVLVDLCPKLIFSKSDFIDVCIESSVHRYLEFQGLKTALTVYSGDHFTPIPTTKSEIFQNKELTLLEKRLLMKFITSISKSFAYQTPATLGRDSWNEARQKKKEEEERVDGEEETGSWADWLEKYQLTQRLKDFLTYGLCLAQEELTATEGLKRLKQFTESLAIYGQSCPLLYPMYGTGDVPQAFTRLAALHETVYALRTKITHFLQDHEGVVRGAQTQRGEVIQCKQIIAPLGLSRPVEVAGPIMLRLVSLVSRRLFSEEGLGLAVTVPTDSLSSVQILQLDHSCGACPRGLYLYHLCAVADREDHEGLRELFSRLLGNKKESCLALCEYVHRETILSSSFSDNDKIARTTSPSTNLLFEGISVTSDPTPLPGFTLSSHVLVEAREASGQEHPFLPTPEYVKDAEETRFDDLQEFIEKEETNQESIVRTNEPELTEKRSLDNTVQDGEERSNEGRS